MNAEQCSKIDRLMSESDLLDDDAVVEFEENGFRIIFGAISDWYNRSITLHYEGKYTTAEMFCLLYELALWCITPKKNRDKISAVITQYVDSLPEPKMYVRTHIIG